MRRSICSGALAVCLAVLPLSQAWAQRHCQPYWTAAYKCMQGCGPCGGGGGGGGYVAPPPINPFPQHLQRFQAILAQVQPFVDYRDQAPFDDQEMSSQLAALYDRVFDVVAAARLREAQVNARLEALAPAAKALEADSNRASLDYTEHVVPQLRQAQAQAAALAQQLKTAKAVREKIEAAQHYYEGWARAQKTSIGRWLNVVLPSSPEVNALGPPFLPMALRGMPIPKRVFETDPAIPAAMAINPNPPQSQKTFTKAVAPGLGGSLEERLAAMEQFAPQLAASAARADQAAATLRTGLERYAQYTGILQDTRNKSGEALMAIGTAQHDVRLAEREMAGVKAETKALSEWLFVDAAEQYAWSNLRNQVVVPELKRLVSSAYAGKPPYELTDAFVDASWSSGKLHLFSLVDKAATFRNAKELVTRVSHLVNGGEEAMLDAARLLAMGNPADATAYAQSLSERLDRDARGVAAQALATGEVPQPYREFWMKYFVP
jgi:hypothetical protein